MAANVDQEAPVQVIPQRGKKLFFSKGRVAMPLIDVDFALAGNKPSGPWALLAHGMRSRGPRRHGRLTFTFDC